MKIKGYRVSVGSMLSTSARSIFPMEGTCGLFFGLRMECVGIKISYKTVVMAIQIRPACNVQEIFLHSSKWQPHSYSDLVDTWADSVCIHQLVLKMCSKAACLMAHSN